MWAIAVFTYVLLCSTAIGQRPDVEPAVGTNGRQQQTVVYFANGLPMQWPRQKFHQPGSYQQHEDGTRPLHVVFELRSPVMTVYMLPAGGATVSAAQPSTAVEPLGPMVPDPVLSSLVVPTAASVTSGEHIRVH